MSSIMLRRFAAPDGQLNRTSVRLGALSARWLARRERTVLGLLTTVYSGSTLLSIRQIAQRLADALVSALLVGSVFVVPLACVLAIVCVALPGMTSLRHIGAEFFGFAIVWFTVAVFGAHLQPRQPKHA